MSIKDSLHLLILLALFINISPCKSLSDEANAGDNGTREKRGSSSGGGGGSGGSGGLNAGLSNLALGISIASYIQGTICTFTDICGGDELTNKLEELEKKLNAVQNDVTSIRHDVEDIWDESKRKWYFKHIDNIVQQREDVIRDLKNKDYSQRAKDRRNRFVLEVFGSTAKDEYVEKALIHIPNLVVQEKLVTHYYDVQRRNGKSTIEAARLTWAFVRKIFRHQEDGYVSVAFAGSIKYKNDDASFKKLMSEVCKRWPKTNDPEYEKECAKYTVPVPYAKDRRKYQQDFLLNLKTLALFPSQLVQTDCTTFTDANAVHHSASYIYVAHPASKKITVIDPKNLKVVKTLTIPGSLCGGNCHPYAASIKAKHKVLAVVAKTSMSGGKSKILLFKISGSLDNPSGITIKHYYTIPQMMDVGRKAADARDIAFCGERLGYADYQGVTRTWRMPDEKYHGWNNGKPVPDLTDRHDWYLRRVVNDFLDHQYYLGCSNNGKYWVVERTKLGASNVAVGALRAGNTGGGDIISNTEFKVTKDDMYVGDRLSRLNDLRGIALDDKKNFIFSSERAFSNGICGVYKELYDGNRHYIWEWEKMVNIKMFGMDVDTKGFVFHVMNRGSGKCLYKFHHDMDLEDITSVDGNII